MRNTGGGSSDMGAYQQDAVQTGFTAISSRLVVDSGNPVGPSSISGNYTTKTVQDSSQGLSTPLSPNTGRIIWENKQRTSSETRPSNVTMNYGIYLGRSA